MSEANLPFLEPLCSTKPASAATMTEHSAAVPEGPEAVGKEAHPLILYIITEIHCFHSTLQKKYAFQSAQMCGPSKQGTVLGHQ